MDGQGLMWLRRAHGALHERRLAAERRCFDKHIQSIGYRRSKRNAAQSGGEDYPVDFVLTWVDGADSAWRAERDRFATEGARAENGEERYRDWGLLPYWFRAAEKYAPWVRYVWLVTWGHVPSWLNAACPELKIVRHDEFIPAEYLPTFSPYAIELNLWRIDGLSEHLVYFNDDVFLTSPVEKSDFFCNGLPRYCGAEKPLRPHGKMTVWEHALFNNAGAVNAAFDVRGCIAAHPEKWFSYRYGAESRYNLRSYEDNAFYGMFPAHLGTPCRRSAMEETWREIPEKLDATCRHRFRSMDDLSQQIFSLWEMCKGSFEPVEPGYYGYAKNISLEDMERIEEAILSGRHRMVCANDWEGIPAADLPYLRERLFSVMERKLPEKSEFES